MLIRPARSAAADKTPYRNREAIEIGVPITISCCKKGQSNLPDTCKHAVVTERTMHCGKPQTG